MRLIVLALLFAAAGVPAQVPPAVTAAEQTAIDLAAQRGALIYAYDRAAWLATDDLRVKMPDFADRVGGWIVDGPADAPELVFFDRDPAGPHAVYVADFDRLRLRDSHLVVPGEPAAIAPARRALIAARTAALAAFRAAGPGRCDAGALNTVVLPPERAGGPTLVYIMAPQTEADAFPLGGHYLVEVAADGRVGAPQPFARSCIGVRRRQDGHEAVVMGVSDLLHPVPTELHVFTALAAGKPLAVMTIRNGRTWLVAGPTIRPLALTPPAAPTS